jgi:hypothetical protein
MEYLFDILMMSIAYVVGHVAGYYNGKRSVLK